MKKYNPDYKVHPGATIRESFIHAVLKDTMCFKDERDKDEVVHLLDELMQGRGCITESLASVLEEATKINQNFWLNCQKNYQSEPDVNMEYIDVNELRRMTEDAQTRIKVEEERVQQEIAEKEAAQRKIEEAKAQAILSQVLSRCQKEAHAGRRHAIVMSVDWDDWDRPPHSTNGERVFGGSTCRPEYLNGACRLVYNQLAKYGLNPTLEDWHDGVGMKSGYNIVVCW